MHWRRNSSDRGGTTKDGATARRLGGGDEDHFDSEVDSSHAPSIGIMLNVEKFCGGPVPRPPCGAAPMGTTEC